MMLVLTYFRYEYESSFCLVKHLSGYVWPLCSSINHVCFDIALNKSMKGNHCSLTLNLIVENVSRDFLLISKELFSGLQKFLITRFEKICY